MMSSSQDGDAPNEPAGGQLINWESALETVAGDRNLLTEILDAFLQEAPRMATAMDTAITSGDAAVLHRAAHTLKGSLHSIGALRVAERASVLEQMGRESQFAGASDALRALCADLDRVVAELKAYLREQAP